MSRRAVAPCLISTAHGLLERASAFRLLPNGDSFSASVHTHLGGKGPAAAQRVVMDGIPPPGSAWVRSTGGQQKVGKAEPEVQHSLTAGEPFGNKQIHGATGSLQCLEDADQGGQAASVSG